MTKRKWGIASGAGLIVFGFMAGVLFVSNLEPVHDISGFGSGLLERALQAPPAEAVPSTGQLDFVTVAKEVGPSVVTISSEKVVRRGNQQRDRMDDPFFKFFGEDFFERFFPIPPPDQDLILRGLGSGVIVSEDGYILTNNHVVAEADRIRIALADGREFSAEIVGRDPETDVAVIKIDETGLPAAKLGDSNDIEVGEWVVAIGNPFSRNLQNTVTAGIISAKGRSYVGLAEYEDFIQTDASINPGNSGGALVNLAGEVIGINTAIASRTGGYQGVGFAIPITMARDVMESLIEDGRVVRGWLGVHIQEVDQDMAEAMKMDDARGILVADVVPDGPAGEADIERGDVIVSFEGHPVNDMTDLRMRVAATPPGTKVKLGILRDNEAKGVYVKLGTRPGSPEAEGEEKTAVGEKIGIEVQPLTNEMAERMGYRGEQGVIITSVDITGAGAQAGLRRDDLIVEVNRDPVRNFEDYEATMEGVEPGSTVLLLIKRGTSTLYVAVPIPED